MIQSQKFEKIQTSQVLWANNIMVVIIQWKLLITILHAFMNTHRFDNFLRFRKCNNEMN